MDSSPSGVIIKDQAKTWPFCMFIGMIEKQFYEGKLPGDPWDHSPSGVLQFLDSSHKCNHGSVNRGKLISENIEGCCLPVRSDQGPTGGIKSDLVP